MLILPARLSNIPIQKSNRWRRRTVTLDMPYGSQKNVGIERLHLEQDAGKSIHDLEPRQHFCRSKQIRSCFNGNCKQAGPEISRAK